MNRVQTQPRPPRRAALQRGSVLPIVLVIGVAIAALAAISSGRVVQESRTQRILEEETRAFNRAYAQLHLAMNIINASAYDAENHNVELREAMEGLHGGTVSVDEDGGGTADPAGIGSGYVDADGNKSTSLDKAEGTVTWLDDSEGVFYGLVEGTNVRVYQARDYIQRLAKLGGKPVVEVDPGATSEAYFVIEAAGRASDTVRLVSALIRENEPFSSFVFFQNRGTLGISGSPRGLIHSNEKIAFYFKDGNYADSVSAVDGFEYVAGATKENTSIRDGNEAAAPIKLENIDFDALKAKATLFSGAAGLDAEIVFMGDTVSVNEYTRPHYETVEMSRTYQEKVGSHSETRIVDKWVQVGETEVTYTEQVQTGTTTETYIETVQTLIGTEEVTKYRDEQVQVGTKEVTKTTKEPIYDTRTVTKTRTVTEWVPLSEIDPDAGGGTVGGGGSGEVMVEISYEEEYQVEETYISGYNDVTTTTTEPVYETQSVPYTETKNIYEYTDVEKTREVPVYTTVEKTRMDPVWEKQAIEETYTVDDYVERTETWTEEVFFQPELVNSHEIALPSDSGGTMYIDGRITKLEGVLDGRLTIVANEKVRVTGDIQYVDAAGNTAMLNGKSSNYLDKYERNSDYAGDSTLGVIARDDIVLTDSIDNRSELNGTLMSVEGRVGIDGFVTKDDGDLDLSTSESRSLYMDADEIALWEAYEKTEYSETRFKKKSLRRMGGVISNNRIIETWIKSQGETSTVEYGFVSGNMKFDLGLLFNPPPSFVEVPRPVMSFFVPVMIVRGNDS